VGVARGTTPEPYSQDTAFELDAAFSPDGKWVAYQRSDVGERANVYVQPYPATGSKSQISRDVGFEPLWRSDGKELFFLSDDGLMAAPIANGFLAGQAQPLFRIRMLDAARTQAGSAASPVTVRDWSTFRSGIGVAGVDGRASSRRRGGLTQNDAGWNRTGTGSTVPWFHSFTVCSAAVPVFAAASSRVRIQNETMELWNRGTLF
jgi:hypothetical protein